MIISSIRKSIDTELSFMEYIRYATEIIENNNLGFNEKYQIFLCNSLINNYNNCNLKSKIFNNYISFSNNEKNLLYYQSDRYSDELKFYFDKNNNLLAVYNNNVCGIIHNGTIYTSPQYRKMGFGKELLLFAHYNDYLDITYPTHFSRSGFENRVSAFIEIKKNVDIHLTKEDVYNEFNNFKKYLNFNC